MKRPPGHLVEGGRRLGEQERVPVRRHREVGEQPEPLGRAATKAESNERVEVWCPPAESQRAPGAGCSLREKASNPARSAATATSSDGPGVEHVALGAVGLGVVEDEPHCHLCAFPASRLPLLHRA